MRGLRTLKRVLLSYSQILAPLKFSLLSNSQTLTPHKLSQMKVAFWVIGKTSEAYLKNGIEIYQKRLPHYLKFEYEVLSDIKNPKNLTTAQLLDKEADMVLKKLNNEDHLMILDEKGKDFTSVQFSKKIEKFQIAGTKKVVFLVGGAFGFSPKIYQRANGKLSLSKMTFSHQMIRLFFLEQLYRAMTILRGEPYHNE